MHISLNIHIVGLTETGPFLNKTVVIAQAKIDESFFKTLIPAAIFAGHFTWFDFMTNIVPTFIGNMIGGAVFVGLIYFSSYQQKQKEQLKKAS